MPPALLLLLQIAVILFLSRLAMPVAKRLGQPPVIAEMVAGLLLGPSLLGWIAPEVSSSCSPPARCRRSACSASSASSLFMFLVGLEIESRMSGGPWRWSPARSIALPFALGAPSR